MSAAVVLSVREADAGRKAPRFLIFVAPAMHESMWLHPATQDNVKTLKSYGYQFIGPEKGALRPRQEMLESTNERTFDDRVEKVFKKLIRRHPLRSLAGDPWIPRLRPRGMTNSAR